MASRFTLSAHVGHIELVSTSRIPHSIHIFGLSAIHRSFMLICEVVAGYGTGVKGASGSFSFRDLCLSVFSLPLRRGRVRVGVKVGGVPRPCFSPPSPPSPARGEGVEGPGSQGEKREVNGPALATVGSRDHLNMRARRQCGRTRPNEYASWWMPCIAPNRAQSSPRSSACLGILTPQRRRCTMPSP